MKCSKCGCEEFAYTETTGQVIRKKLPLWISVVIFIIGIFFAVQVNNHDNPKLAGICVIIGSCFIECGLIYTLIRYVRIRKDKKKIVTKRICKQCNNVEII